jgi:hypothetical protein
MSENPQEVPNEEHEGSKSVARAHRKDAQQKIFNGIQLAGRALFYTGGKSGLDTDQKRQLLAQTKSDLDEAISELTQGRAEIEASLAEYNAFSSIEESVSEMSKVNNIEDLFGPQS